MVEYALNRALSPALVAEYQTRLPDKQLLQAKLHEFYELAASAAAANQAALPVERKGSALSDGLQRYPEYKDSGLPWLGPLMNLVLHGLEPHIKLGDSICEVPDSKRFDVVLTNPPFGTKGANQAPDRDDFTVSTSNKQLNFVQHIVTILKPGGRAAVVLPDNCLFADQAGEVFKIVTEDCDLHTVLRLPRGTFTPSSQGVKANVVVFTKGTPTKAVWIYDARTNQEEDRPLTEEHFQGFEQSYGADPIGHARRRAADSANDRWREVKIAEVRERQFKLDGFKWLKEDSLEDADDLPDPEELAGEAIGELQGAIEELNEVLALLANRAKV